MLRRRTGQGLATIHGLAIGGATDAATGGVEDGVGNTPLAGGASVPLGTGNLSTSTPAAVPIGTVPAAICSLVSVNDSTGAKSASVAALGPDGTTDTARGSKGWPLGSIDSQPATRNAATRGMGWDRITGVYRAPAHLRGDATPSPGGYTHPVLPLDIGLALLVTVGLLAVLAGGLRYLSRTGAPIEALRAYAVAQGAVVRGDGVAVALEIVGALGTRRWTLGYHHPPGEPDVLLVGIDCAAATGSPSTVVGLPLLVVDDQVLAARLTTPPPDLYTPERLGALLLSMADLAQRLEEEHGAPTGPADGEPTGAE